jgi:DNA polymerase-3 subunit alpha
VISAFKERPLKSGNGRMAFVTLEDRVGSIEVLVFSKAFAEGEAALRSNEPILVTGHAMVEGDDDSGHAAVKLRATSVGSLHEARTQATTAVCLELDVEAATPTLCQQIKAALERHPGPIPVQLLLTSEAGYQVSLDFADGAAITPDEACMTELAALDARLRVQASVARRAA